MDWPSNAEGSNNYNLRTSPSKCKTILFEEITSCKPANIVFLTGYDYWASPFTDENLEVQRKYRKLDYLEIHESLKIRNTEINCIVAPHPQGKNEDSMVNNFSKLLLPCLNWTSFNGPQLLRPAWRGYSALRAH